MGLTVPDDLQLICIILLLLHWHALLTLILLSLLLFGLFCAVSWLSWTLRVPELLLLQLKLLSSCLCRQLSVLQCTEALN